MEGHPRRRQARAQVANAEAIDEEFAEFPGDAGGLAGALLPDGVIGEELWIVVAQHGCAAAGRRDDHFGVCEGAQKLAPDAARIVMEAGIEAGLAAAGLRLREAHVKAQVLKHLDDGDAAARVKRIDDAGHEERYGFVTR